MTDPLTAVCAEIERFDLFAFPITRGENDDGNLRRLPEGRNNRFAVGIGKSNV